MIDFDGVNPNGSIVASVFSADYEEARDHIVLEGTARLNSEFTNTDDDLAVATVREISVDAQLTLIEPK